VEDVLIWVEDVLIWVEDVLTWRMAMEPEEKLFGDCCF